MPTFPPVPAAADAAPQAAAEPVTGPRRLDGSTPSVEALRAPQNASQIVDHEIARLRAALRLETEKVCRSSAATIDSAERIARRARESSPRMRALSPPGGTPARPGTAPLESEDEAAQSLTSKFRALR